MKPASFAALLLIAVAMLALATLVVAGESLQLALPGGLPLGNALAAIVLCAAAGAAVSLSVRGTWLRTAASAALVLALSWLPVSIALAGNLALNFDGSRGDAWWLLSLVSVLWIVIVVVWAVAAIAISTLRRSNRT